MSGYGQYLFQWLDGRPKRTAEEYRRDIVQAFDWFQKHLNSLTLEDCQNYRALACLKDVGNSDMPESNNPSTTSPA